MGLELDEHQRQAVDEADDVGPPAPVHAGDPELLDREPVVAGRVVPVDHPHPLRPRALLVAVRHLHRHAVLEQPVQLAVGLDHAHARAVARQLLEGPRQRLGRRAGIEARQRGLEPPRQVWQREVGPPLGLRRLVRQVARRPPELREQQHHVGLDVTLVRLGTHAGGSLPQRRDRGQSRRAHDLMASAAGAPSTRPSARRRPPRSGRCRRPGPRTTRRTCRRPGGRSTAPRTS